MDKDWLAQISVSPDWSFSPKTTSSVPSSHSSLPLLLCNRHKYLCRYVTHIRLQYFRLFPVLHSQLSHCQLSGSYGATAPCLHAYAQSILNHCHCNTHTFLTKGKLCICQGHGPNKGEVRSTVLCCEEHCRLHDSTSSSHIRITHSSPSLFAALLHVKIEAVIAWLSQIRVRASMNRNCIWWILSKIAKGLSNGKIEPVWDIEWHVKRRQSLLMRS